MGTHPIFESDFDCLTDMDCGACRVLQFYADRDSFKTAVECIICSRAIDKTREQLPDDLPTLEELPNPKDSAEDRILYCENEWCTFNIHIKAEEMATKAARAQSMLEIHETKCRRHKKEGRRFKRVVTRNDKEQGCYVDIDKHGLGLPKPKSEFQ